MRRFLNAQRAVGGRIVRFEVIDIVRLDGMSRHALIGEGKIICRTNGAPSFTCTQGNLVEYGAGGRIRTCEPLRTGTSSQRL